jgi:enoyl-CoA hydratase/carnithine racemase
MVYIYYRHRTLLGHIIQFFQDAISKPEECPVPVIAAVHGHCVGGAVDLITACDLRYCTKDSVFVVKEVDLAIVADIGTLQRLPRIIGDQRSRELAYTARAVGGPEAERIGLVLKCFESETEMREYVIKTAQMIASKSPLTVRGIKQTALYARDNTVRSSLDQVKALNSSILYSDDLMEAMKAAYTKNTPKYES